MTTYGASDADNDHTVGSDWRSDCSRSTWDVTVVYADSETRSEFDYRDVETIKRCRRRKSRLAHSQRRPVVVLRDTADRYIPTRDGLLKYVAQ